MTEPLDQCQAGFMLQGLNQHLSSTIDRRLHQHIECWMEEIELKFMPKHQGLGRDMGWLEYTAVFSFEQFPFKKQNPAVVMANTLAWLDDHDEFREKFNLADPSFDIEPESDDTVIMTLEVQMTEPLMVVEDPEGDIYWEGKRWSNAPYEIWRAEHVDVINANNPPSSVMEHDQD
ncbi:phage tail protein [Vibrio parahaemolyticus]|uniref:phage tail protein n=1 Tax=Vibrio parahaemolyticus TaxID=670 RepID=UPI00111E5DFF|nr:phage tail protein [Vibrio parahaemolyticus]EHH1172439.1 hypothetical protein [Vibrio parahaemolyticus]MBE4266494.1 hypothetical protein [Vibrio parahaemolyticus]MBE4415837.1 hypothetical protein [Vibrio parahaemolyticus]TOQ51360.1 hypothetical protein CGG98_09050 [Vibrio parahaemolyticus]HCE3660161.1 phage tail protein [Vibrio parahaemolyticus]